MENRYKFYEKEECKTKLFGTDIANKISKNAINYNAKMKNMHSILKKNFVVILTAAAALLFMQNNAKAQTIIGAGQGNYVFYTYVSKIAGQIVTTQTGLTAKPGDEIEYEVVVAYYSDNSNGQPASRRCTIPIPCYANYHSVSKDTGTIIYNNQKDTIIYEPPMLKQPAAALPYIYGTLTFTVVVTEDCYLLNANCGNKAVVPQLKSWLDYVSYGYPPLPGTFHYVENLNQSTPVEVAIDDANFLLTCPNKPKQYVFLENPSGTIPVSEIRGDFPAGSRFYDTIDESTGAAIVASIEYTSSVGFPAIEGKYSYYAIMPTCNCWVKFYFNVLDTTTQVFCAGDKINKAVLWVSDWDAILGGEGAGSWYLGDDIIDTATLLLQLADNDKYLMYKARYLCGTPPTDTVVSNKIHIIANNGV